MNPSTLSDSIQLAVAPVFLLTAVAGMIGALTHRLARVIDRSRVLHKELMDENLKQTIRDSYNQELKNIATLPFHQCLNDLFGLVRHHDWIDHLGIVFR